mgnify:CR=1 FL=1
MAVGFAGLGLRKKGKEGCDILQSSQEQKDSCKTNAYWHENMLEWDMAAQKKKIGKPPPSLGSKKGRGKEKGEKGDKRRVKGGNVDI